MVIVGCDARTVDTRLQRSTYIHTTWNIACAYMDGSVDKDKDKEGSEQRTRCPAPRQSRGTAGTAGAMKSWYGLLQA